MTVEQIAEGGVDAVVEYDGRVLLVKTQGAWRLPSGDPEPAEPATATAARAVYELTGYLVDGTTVLRPAEAAAGNAHSTAVCQLLSETPSGDAQLGSEDFRWAPIAEAVDAGISTTARVYLEGHTPV